MDFKRELIFIILGETSTTEIIKNKDTQGFVENRKAAKSGGSVGGSKKGFETEIWKKGCPAFKEKLKPLEDKMLPLTKKMVQYYREGNEKGRDELFPQLQAIAKAKTDTSLDFFQKNPDSQVSLYVLDDHGGIQSPTFEQLFHTLSPHVKNSAKGREMSASFNAAQRV